jgi:Tfp pilus assembly protein PilF
MLTHDQPRRGTAVRKIWIATWTAACLAAGCAQNNPPGPGVPYQIGAAGPYGAPPAQQPTWTQRMTAPFVAPPTPLEAHQEALAKAKAEEAQRLAADPISLGYDGQAASAQLYVAMAEMSCRGGNAPQGRALYQKAISLEPQNIDALLGAARMEDREGRMDVAVMLYERAAAAEPMNPTVFNDLGLCLARQEKLPEAERALARAVQLEPAKALYRNNIAKVQVEMNRIDAAIGNLAAVYPPAVVNYNMGVLLHERGRAAESERFLVAALRTDPAMGPARTLLAELRPAAPAYHVAQAPQGVGAATPVPSVDSVSMPPSDAAPTLLPPVN